MLAGTNTSTHRETTLRQGWMLKKAGSGIFAQWKLKYFVLVSASPQTGAILRVFEQCDQSRSAKYTIELKDAAIEIMAQVKDKPSAAGAAGFGKKGFCPFIVYAKQRKFYFAAQTKIDGENWINALRPQLSQPKTAGNQTAQKNNLASRSHVMFAKIQPTSGKNALNSKSEAHIVRSKSRGSILVKSDEDEPHVRPIPDDAVSVISSVGSLLIDGEDGRSSSAASFETLSFCSEPVLTPQELLSMGSGAPVTTANRDDYTRRRKAPMHIQLERTTNTAAPHNGEKWNERYQKVLSARPPNADAALQKDIQLLEIIGAFEEAAVQHAIRMVDEHHLQGPVSKVIKAPDSSAPGALFVDGMILHFACDYDAATADEVDAAMSRTSSELRSIDCVNRAVHDAGSDVNTTLMVLIDYKGFRVVAYADMGIDERVGFSDRFSPLYLNVSLCQTTAIYDLKSSPVKCEESALSRLSLVAKELNLKTHGVQIGQDRRVNVHMGASVQMHSDAEHRRNYAVNLFEIMPMDFIPPTESAASSPARSPTRQDSKLMHSTSARAMAPSPRIYDQFKPSPNKAQRLRPEFIRHYSSPVSSDAFTGASGCGRKERDLNDAEAVRASQYLRETWILEVVKLFDELDVRPLDSMYIAQELHKLGVNVRYLGLVAQLSHIPYIRDMACIEMVARAFKSIFVSRLRSLMIHFRSVGATQIDEETKSFACNMFSIVLGVGEKSNKFFEEKLSVEIHAKFDYEMDLKHFLVLHRPGLFAAMQAQCGVVFEETTEYDFQSAQPCVRGRLVGFVARRKRPTGLSHLLSGVRGSGATVADGMASQPATGGTATRGPVTLGIDECAGYALARHFRGMGPRGKLQRSETTGMALSMVAGHYSATGRPEEARRYATAAVNACVSRCTGPVSVVARAQLIEAMGGLLVPAGSERYMANVSGMGDGHGNFDFSGILRVYQLGVAAVKWNWGLSHPMGMALHDRLSGVYVCCGKYEEALKFHEKSLEIALASFGKNHVVTVGYLAKAGVLSIFLRNTEESVGRLAEALQVAKSISAPTTLVAQIYGHLATALDMRGDCGGALENAQKARKMWEKSKGQMDPRSVAANLQTATLLLKPYESYRGVLTPAIRSAYREAINCFEKVFRFLKNNAPPPGTGGSIGGPRSSGASMMSSRVSVASLDSYVSARPSWAMADTLSLSPSSAWTSSASSSVAAAAAGVRHVAAPMIGPAVQPPFAPLPQLPKSILHKLTKKIVTLKLALVESPHHRDVIRSLRSAREEGICVPQKLLQRSGGGGSGVSNVESSEVTSFDPVLAREVVVKMAAVSPSIYLDGVLARIDDDDGSAIDELAVAIQLAESESLGLTAAS
ncbi:hypothetical protein HDU82_001276 [Entophlyctis luteolus]|nr:hypothetical protein HDU82_001276 [Entophlyctis luteolus]